MTNTGFRRQNQYILDFRLKNGNEEWHLRSNTAQYCKLRLVPMSSKICRNSSSSKRPSSDGTSAFASSGASGQRFPNAASSNLCNFFWFSKLQRNFRRKKSIYHHNNCIQIKWDEFCRTSAHNSVFRWNKSAKFHYLLTAVMVSLFLNFRKMSVYV